MQLPAEYSYKPKPLLFFVSFGAGVAWLGIQVFYCKCTPRGFGLWFGLLPIAMGLLLFFQMLAKKRCVLLESAAITLPSGFLRLQSKRIPYDTIERVWQSSLPYTGVMNIAAGGKRYELLTKMLPDIASYRAIGDFLHEHSRDRLRVSSQEPSE